MSRIVALHEAVTTLELPYTYMLERVPVEKRKARQTLGSMAAPLIKSMRDELIAQLYRDINEQTQNDRILIDIKRSEQLVIEESKKDSPRLDIE